MIDCCRHNKSHKRCIRSSDNRVFLLPRKFKRNDCKNPVGFTMKASCAPYKGCDKVFDVYINQNPSDTITIKYKTVEDVRKTIRKLKKLHSTKKYTYKRIKQVAMILMVRLRVLQDTKKTHYLLAKKYHESLKPSV